MYRVVCRFIDFAVYLALACAKNLRRRKRSSAFSLIGVSRDRVRRNNFPSDCSYSRQISVKNSHFD